MGGDGGCVGGQFTVDVNTINESAYYHFFFYSSEDGQFHDINTSLVYTSLTSAFTYGGSVFCVFDAQYGWGYNPVERLGSTIDLVYDQHTHIFSADDYATFCRWSPTSDTMRMYFYNSNTNHWSWVDTPEHWNQAGTVTTHIYMHTAWPEHNIIVYSSFQDTIMQKDLPDSIFVYTEIDGILACARSENRSFLFNAEKCTVHEQDFEFNQAGMGTRSAAYYDTTGGRILHGYSSVSDQWTTHAILDEPYYCYDLGYIGLVSALVGKNAYGKFYAFNSFGDSWVELVPEGKFISFRVGNRTAVVIQSGHIYAFDPYTSTNISEETNKLYPAGFILQQNYPNPFNSSTTICYELSEPFQVVLKIYNILGQEVRMLVNEHQVAGEWLVTWDGRNGINQPASSGIYIYELQAGGETESRRMFLLNDGEF